MFRFIVFLRAYYTGHLDTGGPSEIFLDWCGAAGLWFGGLGVEAGFHMAGKVNASGVPSTRPGLVGGNRRARACSLALTSGVE